jgi:hypothetical protein
MATEESIKYANISASTSPFVVKGGRYQADVVATFGGGSVKLQKLGPDTSTYLDLMAAYDKPNGVGGTEEDLVIGTFAANGVKSFDLSPGDYRVTIATATGVYVNLTRVPLA